ncbi:hypothetical protein HOLleu_42240 [Holothuria leucospilota]|uniref:Ig-like domain-containing protein n=1 Tax=Holothuria leucospilota TaxID=206669 RepID=A0A9Q1BA86_HOLLE|nr:hypothetical protein HOLleu_42240 [Holothuria leucospilota]
MWFVTIKALLANLFITAVSIRRSHGQCASPQYAEIGNEGLIDCVFSSTFNGVVWYDSQDTSNSQIASAERQPDGSLRISSGNVEAANYTISSNGSLIIRFVTMQHTRNFSVLLFDENDELSFSIVELVTVVYTHQTKPSINSCEEKSPCLTLVKENDTLSCTYSHARPAVNLTWYMSNEGKLQRIEAIQRSFLENLVSFTSVVDIQPATITRNVLSVFTCQAFGPALRLQNVEKSALILNPRMEHCANCDDLVQKKRVLADTHLEIPCHDSRIPYAYVWLFKKSDQTQIIAFSVNMTTTFVHIQGIPMNVSKKGSLIVPRASLSSAGEYTCFFLIDDISSFNVVKVEVEGHPETGHPGTGHPGEGHPGKAETSSNIYIFIVVQVMIIITVLLTVLYLRKRLVCMCACRPTERDIAVMSDVADALLFWPFLYGSDQPLFSEDVIDLLLSISQEATKSERKKYNADVGAGSGIAIAGGSASVVGTAFLPITVGGSIGLIVGGTGLSVNDVSVTTGFALDKFRKETKMFEKAKPSFELYVKIQKHLAISIVHISNVYEIIGLYRRYKSDIDNSILLLVVKEMKKLLKRIRRSQKDRNVTTKAIIENLTIYSKTVAETLLEGLEESKHIPFCIFEEEQRNFKMAHKRAFDVIPETVLKLLSLQGHQNKRTFNFYKFINKLYAPGFKPHARSDITLLSTAENISTIEEVQLLHQVKDDKAHVTGNLEKIAKGVAVAALVLNFLGTVVDVAFLGKSIYDIKGHKTEDLTKALTDTASMMEKMNKIIRKRGEFPDAVVESFGNLLI